MAVAFGLTTVSIAPLPYGSHDIGSVALWCAGLSIAVIFMPTRELRLSQGLVLATVYALLASIALVAFLQVEPERAGLHSSSPWYIAADLSHMVPSAQISFRRFSPVFSIGPTLACVLALTIGVLLGTSPRRAYRTLYVVAWSGTAYAVYGIVSALIDPSLLLWRERSDYTGAVLGTFVNRNTAATYFGSCSVIWFMLICADPTDPERRHPPARPFADYVTQLVTITRQPKHAAELVGFGACLSALFMTNSRAGVLCSLLGLSLVAAVWFRGGIFVADQWSGRLAVLAGVVLAVVLLLGGSLNGRFDAQSFSDEGRLAVYRSTLNLIKDHPWLGVGLGDFKAAFPSYRSVPPSIWGVWDMAHSTPLELAAELGVPVTAALVLSACASFVLLVRGALVRRRDEAIPLTAAGVALIAFLHSTIDFSLQIPGYAIVFMTVLGVGLAQSFSSRPKLRDSSGRKIEGALRLDRQARHEHVDAPIV